RDIDVDVDLDHAGALHERARGFVELLLDARLERDAAEVRHDRNPSAAQFLLAESGFPAAAPRQARRVAAVGAGRDVEEARGVAPGWGEAPEDDRAGREVRVRAARDAAVRALHAEQSGVAGGNADGTATVAAGCERNEPARDGSRAPARRSADRAP